MRAELRRRTDVRNHRPKRTTAERELVAGADLGDDVRRRLNLPRGRLDLSPGSAGRRAVELHASDRGLRSERRSDGRDADQRDQDEE